MILGSFLACRNIGSWVQRAHILTKLLILWHMPQRNMLFAMISVFAMRGPEHFRTHYLGPGGGWRWYFCGSLIAKVGISLWSYYSACAWPALMPEEFQIPSWHWTLPDADKHLTGKCFVLNRESVLVSFCVTTTVLRSEVFKFYFTWQINTKLL